MGCLEALVVHHEETAQGSTGHGVGLRLAVLDGLDAFLLGAIRGDVPWQSASKALAVCGGDGSLGALSRLVLLAAVRASSLALRSRACVALLEAPSTVSSPIMSSIDRRQQVLDGVDVLEVDGVDVLEAAAVAVGVFVLLMPLAIHRVYGELLPVQLDLGGLAQDHVAELLERATVRGLP